VPRYSEFKAAIFDVDDTLLDNKPRDPAQRLHARSRLAAVQAVGERRGIQELGMITTQQNLDAWTYASEHTVEAAVWNILRLAGLVTGDEANYRNELLMEIAALKHELHEHILRTEGREVPGATKFVRALADNGFAGSLAVASTATRPEIDIFFAMTGLDQFFPGDRIIAGEDVIHPKPHKEAFDSAFRTFGLPDSDRRRVLAFDEHPRGIASARAAGLYVCSITTAFDRQDLVRLPNPPDFIADSYAEFAMRLGLPVTLDV